MTHVEITVADHEAYVAAVAERDTLRAKLAEVDDVVEKLRTEFPDLTREGLAPMLRYLSRGWPFILSAKATRERFIACQATLYDAERELESLRKRVAELETTPLRIVLDQGPPTEAGWYVCGERPEWAELSYVDSSDIVGDETAADYLWSRRIDIVVPESEVGE